MLFNNTLRGAARLCLAALITFLLAGVLTARTQDSPLHPIYDNGQQRPPNIVLILFDWARRDALGVYSEKNVSTPNIDRLAARGVRFDNVYTPATLCSPARASILTGVYPHAHGVRKTMYEPGITGNLPTMYHDPIANPFADERFNLAINFPKYLTNSGYAMAHIGKWHLGTGNPGFFDLFKSYNSLMPHWVGTPDESAYREDIQTNEGIRFIQGNADRPFFLYQSYYTPHAPFQPPRQYAELYKDREIDHKNYYASVTSLDHNVGRIIRTLEEQGATGQYTDYPHHGSRRFISGTAGFVPWHGHRLRRGGAHTHDPALACRTAAGSDLAVRRQPGRYCSDDTLCG